MHPVEEWTPYAAKVFTRRFGRWADDDDLQELRIIVWDALREHDPSRGPWSGFLALRVQQRTIDRLRARDGRLGQRWQVNHPFGLPVGEDGTATEPADPVPDFADTVALNEVLDLLPAREREALVETYVLGRPCHELATEWGVSEQYVGQVRQRGATRLAGWLKAA